MKNSPTKKPEKRPQSHSVKTDKTGTESHNYKNNVQRGGKGTINESSGPSGAPKK